MLTLEQSNGRANEPSSEQQSNEQNNTSNPMGEIVLGVYIHCQGCSEEVTKCLLHYDGVEEVIIDGNNHKVIVKGKNVDPKKVTKRLRKKSRKHVELIYPILPEEDKMIEEKKEEPKVIEVELKIYLHCEGCAKDVKYCIHKMQGVQSVEPDMKSSVVKVKGVFDPEKLVEFVKKRTARHVVIVNKNDIVHQKEEKPKEDDDSIYPKYPRELVYAPQLFSDENPNACVMI